ncbi:hypothetical protein [Chryseobacterium indoltheticum]|uniref:hypothetical protein n=1 Tax=Chryseobacterium indoltheticum TaxID=254 RepID=UPI003F493C4A
MLSDKNVASQKGLTWRCLIHRLVRLLLRCSTRVEKYQQTLMEEVFRRCRFSQAKRYWNGFFGEVGDLMQRFLSRILLLGASYAVVESVAKIVAMGGEL